MSKLSPPTEEQLTAETQLLLAAAVEKRVLHALEGMLSPSGYVGTQAPCNEYDQELFAIQNSVNQRLRAVITVIVTNAVNAAMTNAHPDTQNAVWSGTPPRMWYSADTSQYITNNLAVYDAISKQGE